MTNKTIEEMVEEFEKLLPEDLELDYQKPYKEILQSTLYTEYLWPESMLEMDSDKVVDWLRTTLTEAHQAGRDEAGKEAMAREKQLRDIHKIELDTISCMSLEQFVIWSDHRKQPKDNTIKALQDNK